MQRLRPDAIAEMLGRKPGNVAWRVMADILTCKKIRSPIALKQQSAEPLSEANALVRGT